MGRPKEYNFTEQQILEAIKGSHGIVNNVAKKLKVDWNTADKYIKQSRDAIAALEAEREAMLDIAESVVYKSIKGQDCQQATQNARWFLGLKGRHRGFAEKKELELSGNVDLPIKINITGVKSDNEDS